MSRLRSLALTSLIGLLAVPVVHAGRPCDQTPATPTSTRKGFVLAKATLDALEKSGHQVALLARVGSDASEYGIRYTHVGFVWRDHPEGRWRVVHLLNECGTGDSKLYTEGLGNFYMDDLFAWEGYLVFPTPAIQESLAKLFAIGAAANFHQPKYNLVSYPYSEKYQNCTQWTLEVLTRAMVGPAIKKRKDAQIWLEAQGFRPTTMQIGALKRLGARMTRANMAFDDHPDGRRYSGQIDVVTVNAIVDFLTKSQALAGKPVVLALESES